MGMVRGNNEMTLHRGKASALTLKIKVNISIFCQYYAIYQG